MLNQIDKIKLNAGYDRDEYGRINRVQLSAIKGDGIEFLKKAIVERSLEFYQSKKWKICLNYSDLLETKFQM